MGVAGALFIVVDGTVQVTQFDRARQLVHVPIAVVMSWPKAA